MTRIFPQFFRVARVACVCAILVACGGGGGGGGGGGASSGSSGGSSGSTQTELRVNQVGFEPGAAKWVALAGTSSSAQDNFSVINDSTGAVILTGTFTAAANWDAGQENVRMGDFSSLTTPGRYRVKVDGVSDSAPFDIASDVNTNVAKLALKAFYYNRASTALGATYAGAWARSAGHADTSVLVHTSAATAQRPTGTSISAPKGWYDAGDYNKYIVNSGISTYTLLAAYEQFPSIVAAHTVNIPETGNGMPDLINEALWNLDWMLTMQDPNDGGVYFKLTNLGFDGQVMPSAATNARYVVKKSTTSALNFAAVMAQASRIMANFSTQRPGLSADMLAAARSAYAWAKANPNIAFTNPSGVSTGEYGDSFFGDEFAWAAAELYMTTGESAFLNDIDFNALSAEVPYWGGTWGLALMTLSHDVNSRLSSGNRTTVRNKLTTLANTLTTNWQNSAMRVGMNASEFDWGSNSAVLNRGMMLLQAYRFSQNTNHLYAAQATMDYVLGRNGLNMSYVTGLGTRSPQRPHHRPSDADGIAAPIPGWIVGGPQNRNTPDGCAYTSTAAAKRYSDTWCSYSTNEIAINWNAPLVYMGFALKALTPATP